MQGHPAAVGFFFAPHGSGGKQTQKKPLILVYAYSSSAHPVRGEVDAHGGREGRGGARHAHVSDHRGHSVELLLERRVARLLLQLGLEIETILNEGENKGKKNREKKKRGYVAARNKKNTHTHKNIKTHQS